MHKITININQSIYEHIMFFLKSLPKNLIQIESEIEVKKQAEKPSTSEAFGILKGKIKDPILWQKELRDKTDRNIGHIH